MPRNVEIKAKIESLQTLLDTASKLCSGASAQIIKQHDTFFTSKVGRLKLREFPGDGKKKTELIYYNRPDSTGPKISDYVKVELDEAKSMRNLLTITNGVVGNVKKTRYLYLHGQTRIHVDDVEGLGTYMELEVCLTDDQTLEDGTKIAHDIMDKLHISKDQLVEGAYMDAILA
ncbi:CYTH domain-containing protein [Aphelenchoides bicaudatus]|nr:CYTH domain-containing protein [Aphelenchoides bicaudatus]